MSILLLTISSGLLFYKNLFLLESSLTGSKVDFEELRYTDLQINATTAMLRKKLSADTSEINEEVNRVKELMNIVTDVNKSTVELSNSIQKIQVYFDKKISALSQFQTAISDLAQSVNALNSSYNELNKQNIKFVVDKKDFYRECIVDALFYVAQPNKFNEAKLLEDKKILSQITSFATTPNPLILKYSAHIDVIHRRTTELEALGANFINDNSINKEMVTITKYFREAQAASTRDGEIFLTMVFGAIVLYLIALVVILKKLN